MVSAAAWGLHALWRRRKVGNDRADVVLQVSAFEGFVVDAIVNSSDLALDRGEAVVELLGRIVEVRLRDHVVFDEIDGLKNVLCIFVHTRGSIPQRSSEARVRRWFGCYGA
jgi:hypothetical protein